MRSAPVVVWIHGGGFRAGDRRSLPRTVRPNAVFDALTAVGLACATIDYRLAGEAIWPAQRDDVNAVIDFISAYADQYGIDADRVGVWGESAGAHLALMAAMTNPHVKAAVAGYPLTDIAVLDVECGGLPESLWLGGLPSALPQRMAEASPITYVTAAAPPCMLVHGDADTIYPPSQSELFYRRLLEAGVDAMHRFIRGGHSFDGYDNVTGLISECVEYLAIRLEHTTENTLN